MVGKLGVHYALGSVDPRVTPGQVTKCVQPAACCAVMVRHCRAAWGIHATLTWLQADRKKRKKEKKKEKNRTARLPRKVLGSVGLNVLVGSWV